MKWKVSGTLILYVGGHWKQIWVKDHVENIWVPGKKMMSLHYESKKDRDNIIARWLETYHMCEIGIKPEIPKDAYDEYDDDFTWSGKNKELKQGGIDIKVIDSYHLLNY